ncbi:hypothetical protein FSPOR_11962 [Fusarium sporotrichioides]|uniref:Uncharacterized protein n=1 Tax=Fusarium sporotrichioides TaxID=5514 RepID=A0A395RBZ1_FUSSP|nr:hypothetical protein FSPOR_11962 [Fusarium sporotrichioides]
MVYYAYLKYILNEITFRYLLTAPYPETIDEWYREASATYDHVKRLAPDFYIFGTGTQVWDLAPSFINKIMFTKLNDRDCRVLSTISQPERTDVLSGGSYYIRSKSNPQYYWFAKSGLIHATKQGRTRFIIKISGEGKSDSKGTVLIGSDSVSITAVGGKTEQYIGTNDADKVTLSDYSYHLNYSDLKNNFLAQGETGDTDSIQITKSDGYGEEWELVK